MILKEKLKMRNVESVIESAKDLQTQKSVNKSFAVWNKVWIKDIVLLK